MFLVEKVTAERRRLRNLIQEKEQEIEKIKKEKDKLSSAYFEVSSNPEKYFTELELHESALNIMRQ